MDLPYVDAHDVQTDRAPASAYAGLRRFVVRTLLDDRARWRKVFATVWATDPVSGFAITEDVPGERLVLRGRHRFSTYALTFETLATPTGTTLRATTYAVFPGVLGRLYRLVVIGSRAHVLATRAMLRSAAAEPVEDERKSR